MYAQRRNLAPVAPVAPGPAPARHEANSQPAPPGLARSGPGAPPLPALSLRADHDLAETALPAGETATLVHLAAQAANGNSEAAYRKDLRYWLHWARQQVGGSLALPIEPAVLLRFIAHHLCDPVERAQNPQHGMPAWLESGLRIDGKLGRCPMRRKP